MVTGLTHTTTYTFSVAAENASGHGAYSVDQSVQSWYVKPGKPTNLRVYDIGEKTVLLQWNKPNDNEPVATYTVQEVGTSA